MVVLGHRQVVVPAQVLGQCAKVAHMHGAGKKSSAKAHSPIDAVAQHQWCVIVHHPHESRYT